MDQLFLKSCMQEVKSISADNPGCTQCFCNQPHLGRTWMLAARISAFGPHFSQGKVAISENKYTLLPWPITEQSTPSLFYGSFLMSPFTSGHWEFPSLLLQSNHASISVMVSANTPGTVGKLYFSSLLWLCFHRVCHLLVLLHFCHRTLENASPSLLSSV